MRRVDRNKILQESNYSIKLLIYYLLSQLNVHANLF